MSKRITIRIPYSELVWGSCYTTVELSEGETAEQYLAKVQDGTADILLDGVHDEWDQDGSTSQSFDTDEAEIYHDD